MPPGTDRSILTDSPGFLVVAAAALLFAASRAGARLIAGGGAGRGVRPGRLALGHWLPIAAVALVAVAMRRPEVAMGVIFSTALGCLSLVVGIVTFLSPLGTLPPSRRTWPFVLPAALVPLVAGFSGHLTWLHALMMLALGGAVLGVWLDHSAPQPVLAPSDSDVAGEDLDDLPEAKPAAAAWAELVLAVVLAGLGAWFAVRAAVRASESSRALSAGMMAATIISPLLTLPMLGSGSALAQRDQSASMLTTLVAVVMLNLCGLLPAVVLCGYVLPGLAEYVSPGPPPLVAVGTDTPVGTLIPTTAPLTTQPPETSSNTVPATVPATDPSVKQPATAETRPAPATRPEPPPAPRTLWSTIVEQAGPTPYPLTVWRLDTVVLLVLGFALIPLSAGRLVLTRLESAALIVAYALYVILIAMLSAGLMRP
jgi:Ca2+/Na+ antiporter